MVSVELVNSINKLDQTAQHVLLTPQKNCPILKLWPQDQSLFNQLHHLQKEKLLVMMSGLMNNFCRKIVQLDSI